MLRTCIVVLLIFMCSASAINAARTCNGCCIELRHAAAYAGTCSEQQLCFRVWGLDLGKYGITSAQCISFERLPQFNDDLYRQLTPPETKLTLSLDRPGATLNVVGGYLQFMSRWRIIIPDELRTCTLQQGTWHGTIMEICAELARQVDARCLFLLTDDVDVPFQIELVGLQDERAQVP